MGRDACSSILSNYPFLLYLHPWAEPLLVVRFPLLQILLIWAKVSLSGLGLRDLLVFTIGAVCGNNKVWWTNIRRSAPRYWLSGEQKLYKCSYSGPYLLCVHPEAVEPLLEELHEGICGSHTEGKSLAHRALTQGYWWPSMQRTS